MRDDPEFQAVFQEIEAIKGSVHVSKMTGISFTTFPAVTAEEFDEYMA